MAKSITARHSMTALVVAEQLGIHLVVWAVVALGVWSIITTEQCGNACAVTGALGAYALLALGASLSAVIGATQYLVFFRNVDHPSRD